MTRTHLTMAGWGSAEITSTAILNNGTRGRRVQTESWIYSWQSKLGTFSGTDRGYVGFACATALDHLSSGGCSSACCARARR